MNIREYIASGIVESYVMGLANEEEKAEFERLCVTYREIQAAREAFENSLEKYARQGSLLPPAHLRNKVFTNLANGDDTREDR